MPETENRVSLAETIRNEISAMPHIKTSLAHGIVNYSALARKLMPTIYAKTAKKPNEETIIVAIKRYAQELNLVNAENSYIDYFAESEITMQDNIVFVKFGQRQKIEHILEKLFHQADWKVGELRIIIESGEQTLLIVKKDRLQKAGIDFNDTGADYVIENSLVSFIMPEHPNNTYGVIAELSTRLAKNGISFFLVTSPTDLHFLVDEALAEKTYHLLKEVIRDSQKTVKAKNKKK